MLALVVPPHSKSATEKYKPFEPLLFENAPDRTVKPLTAQAAIGADEHGI